jgi:hypothetical protein
MPLFTRRGRGFFHNSWTSVQNKRTEGKGVDLEDQIRDDFIIE